MHKRWLKLSALAMLLIFTCTYSTMAYPPPTVSINGQLRQLDTPLQLVEDRTMVPIRFVIEDPALKGQVYWDGKLKKVAIDCRGKYFEFFIGSKKALVDGQDRYFDAAPYLYQNRTYVPLRFLVENLGASVEWKKEQNRVDIRFNNAARVFAYYYYTPREELEQNAHLFTDIAFRWFETDGQGHLKYEYRDRYQEVLRFAREKGIKTHASVVLMGGDSLHQLLANPSHRGQLVGNLLERVKADGYDGVNIDFEFIKPEDGPLFTTFLQELKTSLGSDKSLSVAVFARTGKENWPTPYEYAKIGKIADQVVVMAYDYHYKTSAPGPVAPLPWVTQVIEYLSTQIPAEKLLLGLPTYGYDWPAGGQATTVTKEKLTKIQANYRVAEEFDQKSVSPYYTYYDEWGRYHQVWLENESSLQAKVEAAGKAGLRGVSFWRIGNGFDDLYRVLEGR